MSLADMIRRMDRLETDLMRLRNQVPVRLGIPISNRLPVLTGVVGSDTLVTIGATAYKGILASGTAPTAVPQADPTSVVTFANGLGKALLDGVYVWVSPRCDPGTGVVTDLITPLPNSQVFLSRRTTTLPITGGGGATVTVYQPFAV